MWEMDLFETAKRVHRLSRAGHLAMRRVRASADVEGGAGIRDRWTLELLEVEGLTIK